MRNSILIEAEFKKFGGFNIFVKCNMFHIILAEFIESLNMGNFHLLYIFFIKLLLIKICILTKVKKIEIFAGLHLCIY